MKVPALNPELAFYLAIGVAAILLVWLVWSWLFRGQDSVFGNLSRVLDQYSEEAGLEAAHDQTDGWLSYDAARSAYAESIGWDLTKGVMTSWPEPAAWFTQGAGPAGYRYTGPPADEHGQTISFWDYWFNPFYTAGLS